MAIYPDSKKVGFFAEVAPGDAKLPGSLYAFHRLADKVGYYDGEL